MDSGLQLKLSDHIKYCVHYTGVYKLIILPYLFGYDMGYDLKRVNIARLSSQQPIVLAHGAYILTL